MNLLKSIVLASLFFIKVINVRSQNSDSLKIKEELKATANINISNNGLSLFPNFSLGKPAAIINLSVGKNRLFFEPELRWGLSGKPWSYIYWLRYRPKPINDFTLQFGVHPAYIFSENTVTIDGKEEKRYISQRYVAAEFVPIWHQSSKFQLGLYIVKGRGLDTYTIRKSTFVSFMPRFPKIEVNKNYYISFFPQLFYLQMDDTKGTYFSESLVFSKKEFPVNISSVFTYKINSTIPGGKVVWNVGLNLKL